jgi:hypothetical protein
MRRDVHPVPSRLRLRRRLLMFSAPVAVIALVVAVKMISVVVAGHSAASHFARDEVTAMRGDVSTLKVINLIEPEKAIFAEGALAVLEGRLDDADAHFSEALAHSDPALSCDVRVNIELVRETQGDIAVFSGGPDQARERYTSALNIVESAPQACFSGNSDPDPDRRAIRNDAAARLAAKIAAPNAAPPPPSPLQPAMPPPPPPPPAQVASAPDTQRPALQLQPDSGDPVERLRQLLEDAAP